MAHIDLDTLTALVRRTRIDRQVGRIVSIAGGTVRIANLDDAAIGDRVRLGPERLEGEIVAIEGEARIALADGPVAGLSAGQAAVAAGPLRLAPDDSWIGRIVDPSGAPMDGRPLIAGRDDRPLFGPAPDAARRRGLGARIETGLKAFNTVLPVVRGQRLGLFAGSGVGKSTLLAALARRVEADVVVLALIGERGREMREFVDKVLGPEGMARTVVVGATADRPASLRARCLPAALGIAEHFRDQGRHVLLLADSVTRHAEAHRQVAAARGEAPVLGGFPASMPQEIMGLCERAGPGADTAGDITALFTVLVAGSDMEGPVADTLRGVLDGHVVLDRAIAERGRFPAIDLSRSVSRSLPEAAEPQQNTLISEARRLIGAYERSEMMIRAGLYAAGSDRTLDLAIQAWPKLDAFLGQSEPKGIAESFVALARCLSRRPDAAG